MADFVKGPWAFTEGELKRRDMSRIHKADDPEYLIGYALCDDNPNVRSSDIANARLMATAPELLESCEALLQMLDEWDSGFTVPGEEFSAVETAREVVAKAKGGAV